ncbi:CRTAC1 family protein [Aliiruegeria sabulilitoris]|uniref:CRTAC1 family protein n=1 Tax=Aliiruegeria sabulilitoris TaxID=1510458 RepID=UPI00083441FC|nr:CRTAC1 family protein [Aliiruegeria sabulilitoris]NDR55737.1 CRTAC1 family protein [Pseudoruegeria sp. M32A2M]
MKWLALLALALAMPATAEIRYVDERAALPVEHVYSGGWEHFVGGGVAVFDCNDDRRPEIFAAGGTSPARLFLNRTAAPGDPFAFDLGVGIPEMTGVTGAYPLDIDSDGLLDLAILRVGPNKLLLGRGECQFEDAGDRLGFHAGDKWSTAFSATWEPGNRYPTLAIGNYVDRTDPEGPFEACDTNELHRPDGDGYGEAMVLEPGFCALSMLFSDWTRSGRADLRVSNDRHYYVRAGEEQMWRMEAVPRLLGEEDGWKRISIWGMGIASRDISGDGRPDLVLTSMADQLTLLSDGESGYVQAPFSIGTFAQRPHIGEDGRPSTGWTAQFGDVNNDGRDDLFIAKGNVDQMPTNAINDPNNLLIQQEDGTFFESSVEAGIATTDRSRGAALADFDGDGLLDLVVANRRAPMELYRNATEGTGNWLALQPRQEGVNGFAIGAWIELRWPDGRISAREITSGGGHVSGQNLPEHFGLGGLEQVAFRVIWPSGEQSDWLQAAAGQSYEIWRLDAGALELRPTD